MTDVTLTKRTPREIIVQAKQKLEAGERAEAIRLLVEGVDLYPANPLLSANLGMAYLRVGESEPALCAFKQAVAKSQSPLEWFRRGLTALEQGVLSLHGLKLAVPPDVVSTAVLRYLIEGTYEGRERTLLQHALRADDRVLELGAGLGFLACVAAHEHPDAEYLAIEANPRLIPVILNNFESNGCRAKLLHGVAAAVNGAAAFNLADDFWASSTAISDQKSETIEVSTIDVNAVIRDFLPTMMIVDIEGGELGLIQQLDLSGVDRLVIELHPDVYGHRGSTLVMQSLFYAGFLVDAKQSGGQVFLFKREVMHDT